MKLALVKYDLFVDDRNVFIYILTTKAYTKYMYVLYKNACGNSTYMNIYVFFK